MIILFGKRFLQKEFYFLQIPCLFLKSQTERFLASLLLYYRGKNEKEYENVFKEIHHVAINASNYQATKNFMSKSWALKFFAKIIVPKNDIKLDLKLGTKN